MGEVQTKFYNVFHRIEESDRPDYKLIVDAVYRSDPDVKNFSGEVLSKLLGVGIQGGFRFKGSVKDPKLVVLFTSGEDIYWRDELDATTGLLLYYGDNKIPGNDLHNTKLHGNEILRNVFDWASNDELEIRKKIPPILIFRKNNSVYAERSSGRDVKFLGLAVPGINGRPKSDWLTAVWGCNRDGNRFQNYKSYFTVLDTSKGSSYEPNVAGINLAWLTDIEHGFAMESKYAPYAWIEYIQGRKFTPLTAKCEKYAKSKEEQLPQNQLQKEMLSMLQNHFIEIDNGYSFEKFASDLIISMDPAVVDIMTTRPYKDGGFDAIGKYRIFTKAENSVFVDFYVQAKCYNSDTTPVVVKDTARLISRIKDRQFGILITTSYVAKQAYEEILEDGHPVVILSGRNIIEYLFNKLEIRSVDALENWLMQNYAESNK